jgi:hypothetical protein
VDGDIVVPDCAPVPALVFPAAPVAALGVVVVAVDPDEFAPAVELVCAPTAAANDNATAATSAFIFHAFMLPPFP